MALLAARASQGMTVIAVTHHLDNVDRAGKLLILGHGEVVWFGSRVEALGHFGVNRLADVYLAIEDKPAGFWSARWREREAENRRLAGKKATAADAGMVADGVAPPAVLAAVSIPGFGRQFATYVRRELETAIRDRRGLAMSLRERDFVRAARYMGVPTRTIIVRHLLPNMASILIIAATLNVAGAILAETGLSYLGFGVQAPDVSLGTLIAEGTASALTYPWLFMFAGGILILTVLAFSFIGDGIRDAFDPGSSRIGRRSP